MDLQKVKDALELDILRFESFGLAFESVGNLSERDRAIRCIQDIRETLAELEKPADDTSECAGSVLALFANGGNIGYVLDKVKTEIQQYAESYHAKKCADCKQTVWCSHCGDPITIGVCENCVPDMFDNNHNPI